MGRSSSRCLSQRSSKCRSQFQMTRYLMAQQQGRTRDRTSRCPAGAGRQTTCPLRRINLRLGGGSVIFRLPTIGEAQPGRLAKKKSAPTSTKSGLRRSQNPTVTTSPITQAAAQRGAWRRFVTFFLKREHSLPLSTASNYRQANQCAIEPQSHHQFFQYNDARMT